MYAIHSLEAPKYLGLDDKVLHKIDSVLSANESREAATEKK